MVGLCLSAIARSSTISRPNPASSRACDRVRPERGSPNPPMASAVSCRPSHATPSTSSAGRVLPGSSAARARGALSSSSTHRARDAGAGALWSVVAIAQRWRRIAAAEGERGMTAAVTTESRVEFLNPDGSRTTRRSATSRWSRATSARSTSVVRTRSTPRGRSSASVTSRRRPSRSCETWRTALDAVGAGPEHVVKWNIFIVDGQDVAAGYAAFQRGDSAGHHSRHRGVGPSRLPRRDGRHRGRSRVTGDDPDGGGLDSRILRRGKPVSQGMSN